MLIEQPVSAYQQPGPLQVSRWDFCLSDFISSVLCEMSPTVKRCGEQRISTVRFNVVFNEKSRISSKAARVSALIHKLVQIREVDHRGGNDFKRLL